jgi:hypothetical protein
VFSNYCIALDIANQVLSTPTVRCNYIPLRVKDREHQPRSDVSAPVREQKTCNHMSQPSAHIHLDHTIIRTFRTCVKEWMSEGFLSLLLGPTSGGQMPMSPTTLSLQSARSIGPHTGCLSMAIPTTWQHPEVSLWSRRTTGGRYGSSGATE